MDSIVRAAITYLFVLVILRIAGKRSLTEMTTFDFILILIISETTQEALTNQDHSMTNSLLLILTFFGIDILLSHVKHRSKRLEQLIDGTPLVLVEEGKVHKDRMDKERVDMNEIVDSARKLHGLESLDQIKYAVLDASGGISVVPKEK